MHKPRDSMAIDDLHEIPAEIQADRHYVYLRRKNPERTYKLWSEDPTVCTTIADVLTRAKRQKSYDGWRVAPPINPKMIMNTSKLLATALKSCKQAPVNKRPPARILVAGGDIELQKALSAYLALAKSEADFLLHRTEVKPDPLSFRSSPKTSLICPDVN